VQVLNVKNVKTLVEKVNSIVSNHAVFAHFAKFSLSNQDVIIALKEFKPVKKIVLEEDKFVKNGRKKDVVDEITKERKM